MTDAQIEDIKAGKEKLMNSAQALFAKVYGEAAQGSAGAGPDGRRCGNAGGGASYQDSDVVDGDYKEV